MAQLSRKQKYQELRDQIDENTTVQVKSTVSFPRPYGDIDYTSQDYESMHAARPMHSHQAPEAPAQKTRLVKSEVMNDLLGEVKQYNIDNGDRLADDTQLNILRTLDNSQQSLKRSRHIVPMEEAAEKSGDTMRIEKQVKPAVQSESIDTFLPDQKLTRINPVRTSRAARHAQVSEEVSITVKNDILADAPAKEDELNILGFDDEIISFSSKDLPAEEAPKKPSFFSRLKRRSAAETQPEQPVKQKEQPSAVQPEVPAEKEQEVPKEKKKSSFTDSLSILFEDPFEVEEEPDFQEEEEPKSARKKQEKPAKKKPAAKKESEPFFTPQNILILVLILVLLLSIGLTVFILKKSGIL